MRRAQDRARGPERTERAARRSSITESESRRSNLSIVSVVDLIETKNFAILRIFPILHIHLRILHC